MLVFIKVFNKDFLRDETYRLLYLPYKETKYIDDEEPEILNAYLKVEHEKIRGSRAGISENFKEIRQLFQSRYIRYKNWKSCL